jgi:hypothetical protein
LEKDEVGVGFVKGETGGLDSMQVGVWRNWSKLIFLIGNLRFLILENEIIE